MPSWSRTLLSRLFKKQLPSIDLSQDSPFNLAIKSIISKERFMCPEDGRFGVVDHLPLIKWVRHDGDLAEKEAIRLMRKGKLTEDAATAILLTALPTSIKTILLKPCSKDEQSPAAMTCYAPQLGAQEVRSSATFSQDYFWSMQRRDIFSHDEETKMNAARGMIVLCLHAFLGGYLAGSVEDVVKALQFPGSPQLSLSMEKRLALGVIREMIILQHFPSLQDFWAAMARMQAAGRNMVSYSDLRDRTDRKRVHQLLQSDAEALALYEVMVAVVKDPISLESLVRESRALIKSSKSPEQSSSGSSIELSSIRGIFKKLEKYE